MHYPGERCPPLLLPGPKFLPELLPEPFANTCQPLSITKTPVTRWHTCPQSATALSLSPCQPLVQKCLLLYPEPCDTTRLLPRREGLPRVPQPPPASERPRGDKKRVARSLPPCAPRCPEPGRLRFPPCGIRCSSASCRGHKVAKNSWRCPELTSGYSLPLKGVTECPPQQQSAARTFLQEYLGGVAAHRCSKGYPTQEFVTCCCSEQRLSNATACCGVAKECPQLRGTQECPQLREVAKGTQECHQLRVAKGAQECHQLRAVAKGARECPQLQVTKGRSCSAQNLSKSRGSPRHPRGSPRPSRLAPAAAKRSGHAKKSRCASKWLW